MSIMDLNALDAIPVAQHAAIQDGTSTFDVAGLINNMIGNATTRARKRVILPAGRLALAARLYVTSDTEFVFENTELFMLGAAQNGSPTQGALWAQDVYNWALTGYGKLNGNRFNRSANSGESGIFITKSDDFRICPLRIVHFGGDAISMGGNDSASGVRVGYIEGVTGEANARNGVSFAGVTDVTLNSCRMRAQSGAAPQSGYAFEPDIPDLGNTNITLFACQGVNNSGWGAYASNAYGPNDGIKIYSGRYTPNGQGSIGDPQSVMQFIGSPMV